MALNCNPAWHVRSVILTKESSLDVKIDHFIEWLYQHGKYDACMILVKWHFRLVCKVKAYKTTQHHKTTLFSPHTKACSSTLNHPALPLAQQMHAAHLGLRSF